MNEVTEPTDDWLSPEYQSVLQAALGSGGMPPASLALYARWWQLETWLREIIYVELRAQRGVEWTSSLPGVPPRQAKDATFTHMAGPDNENPLAYLDYSQLVAIIESQWELFSYALPEKRSWEGRQEDLKQIRHRIGHLRKPHSDDLGRVEQTLRDLERGAFIAYASYNRKGSPDPAVNVDPVTTGWIKGQHETAQRLLRHARDRYETTLNVHVSKRPWASWPDDLEGAPGILWHADFYMSPRTISGAALWRDTGLRLAKPLLVHLLVDSPWHVGFTFSAVDDAEQISDAIGDAFDALLLSTTAGMPTADTSGRDARNRIARELDYRVLVGSGWGIVDETTIPISNFGAGGGVESLPSW